MLNSTVSNSAADSTTELKKTLDSPNILPEYLQAVRQSCWLLFTSTGTLTAAVSLTSYESE